MTTVAVVRHTVLQLVAKCLEAHKVVLAVAQLCD
jgi:hypothetical protein